jgi:hypothetical protein
MQFLRQREEDAELPQLHIGQLARDATIPPEQAGDLQAAVLKRLS